MHLPVGSKVSKYPQYSCRVIPDRIFLHPAARSSSYETQTHRCGEVWGFFLLDISACKSLIFACEGKKHYPYSLLGSSRRVLLPSDERVGTQGDIIIGEHRYLVAQCKLRVLILTRKITTDIPRPVLMQKSVVEVTFSAEYNLYKAGYQLFSLPNLNDHVLTLEVLCDSK